MTTEIVVAQKKSSATGAARLWIAIAVTVTLWASAFVGIRIAAPGFSPGALTLGRIAVGSLALTLLRLVSNRAARRGSSALPGGAQRGQRGRIPRGKVLLLVVAWGVGWFGIYNLALNAAERHVDAGTASLLINVVAPMIIAVLAGLLLGEGFPRRLIAGMIVAASGVAVIAAATSTGEFDAIGIVLGIAAAVVYASAATFQKVLLRRVDAATMTWLGCLSGTIACLPFAPQLISALTTAPLSSIVAVAYLGVFPTAIAFTTWGYVLSHSSAGRSAASTYAVPAVVVLLSFLLLKETPPPAALPGEILALGGVAVATLHLTRRSRT
jgi:drug/metabolite transporter (DMT)-like permease